MSPRNRERPGGAASAALLPVILVLFLGSGCAALVYEIVWFQLLELVIGSSAISLGVAARYLHGRHVPGQPGTALSHFPAPPPAQGLCRNRDRHRRARNRDLGVALCRPSLYRARRLRPVGIFLRGLVCGALLVPPTMLMGATLPAVARFLVATPRGISWLGILYTGNIAGAVFDSLFAGFYLLRVYDMAIATYAAAAINGVIGLIALAVARAIPYRAARTEPMAAQSEHTPIAWGV